VTNAKGMSFYYFFPFYKFFENLADYLKFSKKQKLVDVTWDIVILPNYATPRAFEVVNEFVTAMQKEVDFVLTELAAHISNHKEANLKNKSANLPNSTPNNSKSIRNNPQNSRSNFSNEYNHKQQIVDERYYDLLEHFNYLL
jgi:hypothetical protein